MFHLNRGSVILLARYLFSQSQILKLSFPIFRHVKGHYGNIKKMCEIAVIFPFLRKRYKRITC
jgi:hypothetical protein